MVLGFLSPRPATKAPGPTTVRLLLMKETGPQPQRHLPTRGAAQPCPGGTLLGTGDGTGRLKSLPPGAQPRRELWRGELHTSYTAWMFIRGCGVLRKKPQARVGHVCQICAV